MSDAYKDFLKEVSVLLNDLREDLELVLDSKTDLPQSVLDEFGRHIRQAQKMENSFDEVIVDLTIGQRRP